MFHKSMYLGAALCAISFGSFAQSNQADIKQNGSGNAHTVEQFGSNGKLTLIQGTGSHHSTDNTAMVKMGGDLSEVFIQQVSGPTSNADVYIGGIGNYSKIKQQGANHDATISQGEASTTPYDSYKDNKATIDQQGEWQGAVIIQGYDNMEGYAGGATGSEAKIEQKGSGNEATTVQGISAFSEGDRARTRQNGVDNRARIFQGFDGFGSADNHATLEQQGDLNYGVIHQGTGGGGSFDNTALLKQHGGKNVGEIYQGDGSVAESSEAKIDQNGYLNTAELYQGYSTMDAVDVKGTIIQHGDANEAALYQVGEGHTATLRQNGAGNSSMVAQGMMLPTP